MENTARIQGSRIRLISKSEIRYEGTLSQIDPIGNTVSLKNVRMHGTEGRPAEHQIPPSDALYDFIVFRGSDIKDLTVYESKKSEFVDPAVVTAQPARGGGDKGGKSRNAPSVQQAFSKFERQQQGRSIYDDWHSNDRGGKGRQDRHHDRMDRGGYNSRGRDDWHDRSYDRNDRYMHGGKGGKGFGGKGRDDRHHRRNSSNNRQQQNRVRENPLATHTGMNFKVDEKKAQAKRKSSGLEAEFDFEKENQKIDMEKLKQDSTEKTELGYDKSKSFFDSLSCETTEKQSGEGGRYGKQQRETSHNQDIETFGEDAVSAIEKSFTRSRKRYGGRQHNNNHNHRHHGGRGGRGYGRGGGGGGYGRGGRRW